MTNTGRHYFKELRLQQFRSLVALSNLHTFSAAAAALDLTRSSVWQQVRALEQEMGCSLVHTREHRVELTPAGQKLVEIAAPLVASFDSIKSALQEHLDQSLPQTLIIATPPTFLVYELREPIKQLHQAWPKLQLTFLEQNSPAAASMLEQGCADLAIAARLANTELRPTLEYTPFTRYPFTLICPEGHPLETKPHVTLRDLTRFSLILPGQATYCRQHFDAVVAGSRFSKNFAIVLESNFPTMLSEYVRMGLGVAISPLPSSAPGWRHEGVRYRDVAHLFGEEEICHVRRKGEFESPAAAELRRLLTSK
jgi:DNA-binding transcriptional LysR family regulator